MKVHRITVAAVAVVAIATLLGIATFGSSEPAAMPNTLALRSGYASDGNVGGFEARTLNLYLEQTPKGWKGWMTPDPNLLNFNPFGRPMITTLMAGEQVEVSLRLVATCEETGRRSFEVVQERFMQTMHLVFPPNAGGTYRLMIENPDGRKTIVLLEADDGAAFVATGAR